MTARILTVDDSASIRLTTKVTLSNAGYDVTEAAHGGEGLEKAKEAVDKAKEDAGLYIDTVAAAAEEAVRAGKEKVKPVVDKARAATTQAVEKGREWVEEVSGDTATDVDKQPDE